MVLTLCHDCVQPFIDDKNYIVKPAKLSYVDKHDDECFICCRKGRDYDIIEINQTLRRRHAEDV